MAHPFLPHSCGCCTCTADGPNPAICDCGHQGSMLGVCPHHQFMACEVVVANDDVGPEKVSIKAEEPPATAIDDSGESHWFYGAPWGNDGDLV